jgi:hypothetical protein
LSRRGVSVWLDTDRLRIGDRLRFAVDSALSRCDRFVANTLSLLPILHNIDREEVLARSPSLGFCVSRSTSEFTVTEIAEEVAQLVGARRISHGASQG